MSARIGASVLTRGISYVVQDTLYVALTDRFPAPCTLPVQRGPGFRMSAESHFVSLSESGRHAAEPSVEEVIDAVERVYIEGAYDSTTDKDLRGVVVAGLGDPLLRFPVLLSLVEKLKARRPGAPIRINTSGLVWNHPDRDELLALAGIDDVGGVGTARGDNVAGSNDSAGGVVNRLVTAGVGGVNVLLPAASAAGYAKLMGFTDAGAQDLGERCFGYVCEFLRAAAEHEDLRMRLTCTAVDVPGVVDVAAIRDMALALGATDLRMKGWHP